MFVWSFEATSFCLSRSDKAADSNIWKLSTQSVPNLVNIWINKKSFKCCFCTKEGVVWGFLCGCEVDNILTGVSWWGDGKWGWHTLNYSGKKKDPKIKLLFLIYLQRLHKSKFDSWHSKQVRVNWNHPENIKTAPVFSLNKVWGQLPVQIYNTCAIKHQTMCQ